MIGHPVSTQTVLEETFLPSQPSFHFMLWGALMDIFLFGQINTNCFFINSLSQAEQNLFRSYQHISLERNLLRRRMQNRRQKPKNNTLVQGWETPCSCLMFVRHLCAYALMPVANECHCCRELEELNQKCNNSGLTYYVIILTSILFEAATSKLRVTKGHQQGLMDENY